MRGRRARDEGITPNRARRLLYEEGDDVSDKRGRLSPAAVSERVARLRDMGIGGLILHFRVGPMSWTDNERSLRLFAREVMPRFRGV